ncbi:MAG: FKBP-type peptidyl-prolyl cis-trans isomerase [Rickettsiales bacterium]|jgi:trigger factor|nr:FKBP-type peptidyl-prolyl cis-trans isomerase [Rickettsiales bacterium]
MKKLKAFGIIGMTAALFACSDSEARPAQMGDTVIIDFVGSMNGQEFAGGRGESYPLMLGSNAFVPGFESQIVGMRPGDTKNINITFPANYYPELAGKPATFKVSLKQVK